jgi:hypothetical protein
MGAKLGIFFELCKFLTNFFQQFFDVFLKLLNFRFVRLDYFVVGERFWWCVWF